MPIDRTEPLARYRIIQRHGGGQATIEYADGRADALSHQAKVGGEVEVYEDSTWRSLKDSLARNAAIELLEACEAFLAAKAESELNYAAVIAGAAVAYAKGEGR
jgi:hypothetical protein